MSPKRQAAIAVLCAAALFALQLRAAWHAHTLLGDYRAFWCAASGALHGDDPYRTLPLLSCERGPMPWHLYGAVPNVAVPSPLPPYAIALFAPLAALPYAASCAVFMVLLLFCVALSVRLSVRLYAVPAIVALSAFALPAVYLWLPYGEIVPIVLACALLAAWALRHGRWAAAAAAMAVLAIEPHAAVAAWIAVAAYRPSMRWPLAAAAAVLAALWLAVMRNSPLEYFAAVLPLHALAELPRASQLSSAWVLHALGAADGIALRTSALLFATGIAAGAAAGGVCARRMRDDAMLIVVPLAAAVAAANFLHAAQTALLLPLAFLLWTYGDAKIKTAAAAAVVGIAVPWMSLLSDPLVTIPAAVAALAVARALLGRTAALRSACAIAVLCAAVLVVRAHDRVAGPPPRAFPVEDSTLAPASWGRYVWNNESRITVATWAVKGPLWTAILLLIGGSFAFVRAQENVVAPIGIEQAPLRS